MTYRTSFKWTGVLMALAITACGGGGSGESTVAPTPPPPVTPEQPAPPTPPVIPTPVATDRIELLDTGLPKLANNYAGDAPRSAAVPPAFVRLGPLEDEQSLVKKAAQAPLTKGTPQQIGV